MDTKTIQQIQQQVDQLLNHLNLTEVIESTVEVGESQIVQINLLPLDEEENLGILIGRGGETLHALQLLLALMINRGREEWLQVAVDVDGYRDQREESLRNLALRMAEKCRFLDEPIPLRPMFAADRRIVHITLSEVSGVATESTGEGRGRRVVVKPV